MSSSESRQPLSPLKVLALARGKQISGFVIGAFHANVIGAVRFPSSIAMTAVLFLCPWEIFRSLCPKMSISPSQAIHWRTIQAGSTPAVHPVARRQSVSRTLLTHSSRAPGIFCATRTQKAPMGSAVKRPNIGCLSINISAVSNMPFCIFSIHASSPAR